MKKIIALLPLAALIAVVPGKVWAEEILRAGEILVEENEEVKALEERRESAIAKTVITRKEMEELGGQTAADVLRRLPRTYFSGPPTTNKDVRQAGLDKEFQNVLINGNRPPGGGEKREFTLDRIPVEMIERIEVMKNPSAAYDADGIAGLVNIILKEPPKKQVMQMAVGGSYQDQADKYGNKLSLTLGDQHGPVNYTVGATRNDDYRGKAKTVADSTKNEAEQEAELVKTLTTAVNPVLAWQPGERDKITVRPFFTDQTEKKTKDKRIANLTTGAAKSLNRESERKEQFLESYALEWEHRFVGGSLFKLLGSASSNDEDKNKYTAAYTGTALVFDKHIFENEEKEDREQVVGLDFKSPWLGPFATEHLFSTGIKLRNKDREVDKLVYEVKNGVTKVTSTANDSYRVDERITALYFMDEAGLTSNLTLTPGVRAELTDGRYLTSGGLGADDSSVDLNPSLHARYKLGGDYLLRGSVARVIGRPPFKDKVPTRSVKADKVEEGNPDLVASSSINYEAAIERYLGKSGLLSVGAFYKDIDDVIEKLQTGIDGATGLQVIKPVNGGSAEVRGVEFEARNDLAFIGLPDFTVIGNLTFQDSEVIDPNTGVTRRLKDQPQRLGNLILRYHHKPIGLAASLGVSYMDNKVDESVTPIKTEDAFVQWDASLSQTLAKGVSAHASVINLFDEKREVAQGGRREEEEVGRIFYLGLRYEL